LGFKTQNRTGHVFSSPLLDFDLSFLRTHPHNLKSKGKELYLYCPLNDSDLGSVLVRLWVDLSRLIDDAIPTLRKQARGARPVWCLDLVLSCQAFGTVCGDWFDVVDVVLGHW